MEHMNRYWCTGTILTLLIQFHVFPILFKWKCIDLKHTFCNLGNRVLVQIPFSSKTLLMNRLFEYILLLALSS